MRKAISCLTVLSFLLALAGCGDFFTKETGGGGGGSHSLYAADSPQNAAGTLTAFTIGTAGALSSIGNVTIGALPQAIVVTPNNNFLYAANGGGGISAFQIAAGGGLTAVTNQPFGMDTAPFALAVDPTNTTLFTLNLASATISAFTIQSDGSLVVANGQQLPAAANYFDLAITPNGNFLYVGTAADTFVYQLGSGAQGNTFTQVTCTNACTIPSRALATHPNNALLFVADGTSQLAAYSLNSNGVPSLVSNVITGLSSPVSLAVDTTGDFLLVVTSGDNMLTSYSILTSGTLNKIASVQVGSNPVQVRVDPGTNTVYVANQGGNPDISAFTLSTSGQLTTAGTASAGGNATAIGITH